MEGPLGREFPDWAPPAHSNTCPAAGLPNPKLGSPSSTGSLGGGEDLKNKLLCILKKSLQHG